MKIKFTIVVLAFIEAMLLKSSYAMLNGNHTNPQPIRSRPYLTVPVPRPQERPLVRRRNPSPTEREVRRRVEQNEVVERLISPAFPTAVPTPPDLRNLSFLPDAFFGWNTHTLFGDLRPLQNVVPSGATEAEVLYQDRQARRAGGPRSYEWVDMVNLAGQAIGIEEHHIPNPQVDTYVIQSKKLADRAGVPVGTTLTRGQLENHKFLKNKLHKIGTGVDAAIEFVQNGIHPAYEQRPFSDEQAREIDALREEVDRRIKDLDANHGAPYVHPDSLDGTLWVNPSAEGNPRQSAEFTNLIDALHSNDKPRFTEQLVTLASYFSPYHIQAKRAFIDAFTHLYVTEQFPSEGIRQNYFHFTLRCGHLHAVRPVQH